MPAEFSLTNIRSLLPQAGPAPVVESHSEVGVLADEWRALADRLAAPPFLRPGWVDAWYRSFDSEGAMVLAVRQDGALTGVLPVLRRATVLEGAANSHTPLYGVLNDGPAAAEALARTLVAIAPARTDLLPLGAADPLLGALRAQAEAARRPVLQRVVARQPYVELGDDFESYRAALPRKHRKEIGRLGRRLAAEGEVSYEFPDGSERLEELLAEGFAIEGSGWKSDRGTSIAARPEVHRFYSEMAQWAAERGWLRLAFLRLDGRPLAFDFCIEAGGVLYALKGGYDTEYRRFGPGTLLTYESLRGAFERGLRTYEFLGEDDPYKLNWTTATRDRVRVQVFSRSPLGRAKHVAWRYGRPLVKGVQARAGRR